MLPNYPGLQCACAWLTVIRDGVETLKADPDNLSLQDALRDFAISQAVRSGWCEPGEELQASEYCVIMEANREGCRILGRLNHAGDPITATLEYRQDGEAWQVMTVSEEDLADLLYFIQTLYWGN